MLGKVLNCGCDFIAILDAVGNCWQLWCGHLKNIDIAVEITVARRSCFKILYLSLLRKKNTRERVLEKTQRKCLPHQQFQKPFTETNQHTLQLHYEPTITNSQPNTVAHTNSPIALQFPHPQQNDYCVNLQHCFF